MGARRWPEERGPGRYRPVVTEHGGEALDDDESDGDSTRETSAVAVDDGPDTVRVVVSVAVLAAIVVLVGAIGWWGPDGSDSATSADPVDSFVAAFTRSLNATYKLEGEFVRTTEDGRSLSSGLLVVQRPPDRVQRSLGSTAGTINDRSVNCGVPTGGGAYTCAEGGVVAGFDQRRARQLTAIDDYVRGDDPVYSVTDDGDGCFGLVRRRADVDATYGTESQLCFDASTGALQRLQVRHDGGTTDVLLGIVLTGEVSDADFDLDADATYDPQVPDDSGTPVPTTS